MKVWSYDIWDGDKGIIFAETEEKAKALYERNYDGQEKLKQVRINNNIKQNAFGGLGTKADGRK